jgi:two-component system, NtrC family, response regulator AtoC
MVAFPSDRIHFNALCRPDLGQCAGDAAAAGQIIPRNPAKILPRVLVVDDEPLLRWSLAEMLGDAGYQVVEARTGREARIAIADEEHPIDIMLMDVKLPDADGLQLVHEARIRCLTGPILVMTAYGTADTVDAALRAGAHAVVPKPFDLEDMLRIIREVCPPSSR